MRGIAGSSPSPREAASGSMVDQPRGFDLLRLPGVRRFVRWRYARLVFQVPLLLLAVMAIVDGLTGQPTAPRNVATASVWLHYRGLVVIALAVFGNAFCAACPLMLTRGLTRRVERWLPVTLAWPRALHNKVLVIVLTLAFLWSYEVFSLWASPWLTAWLAIGYFLAAFVVDALFPAGTFCRYVCPLGNFNFALSSVSPTQIGAVDAGVCRTCEHKPCLYGRETALAAASPPPGGAPARPAFIPLAEITNPNGSGSFPGCETNLFVPAVESNMDCTLCLNCVRACPYDNVALRVRAPGRELVRAPWARRGGLAVMLLGVLLTFWGVMNAVAMIGPFYTVGGWVARVVGTHSEALLIALLYGLVTLIGLGVTLAVATWSDVLGGAGARPWQAFQRWGYVVVALGFGFWAAHYLFHFLTGAAAAVPVYEHFFSYRGVGLEPDWPLAHMMPARWLFPLQAVVTALYAGLALVTAVRIGLRDFGRRGVVAMWPMFGFVLAFTAMQILVWAQPMQMRGTLFGPGH
ncbi:MAG: hypothetical protein P8Y05_05415 [Deinococcales bacterium]